MRLDRTLVTLTLLCAVVAVPTVALSQNAAPLSVYPECKVRPTRDESEAGHTAFIFGKRKVDEADYATAVSYFKDAYRADCTKHELLPIIARTYELAGNKAEAINALEVYLKRVPEASDAETQRTRIANLRTQLSQPSASGSALVPAAASATANAFPTASASTTLSVIPTASATGDLPNVERPAAQHTITPWIVTVVGGAALVTGTVLIIAGQSSVSSANDSFAAKGCDVSTGQCPPGSTATKDEMAALNDKLANGTNVRTAGFIVAGAGIAGLAGGLVWHFAEKPRPRSARVVPVVGPGYGGLSLGGAF